MLHSTNIRMLQKHLKVATFEGSFESNTFIYALIKTQFKHHRGRPTTEQIWVFGLVDTSRTPALGYMEIVPQRDAATLLPLINAHV